MTDLVTSLVAAFVGGVYGRQWLGRAGLVGGVAIGLSLGYFYPRSQERAEAKAAEREAEVRRRIPLVGRQR